MSLSDPKQVRRWLEGVDYPASKELLVDQAERNAAPEEVVSALRAMPPVDYANPAEVLSSVHVSGGQTDAEKAEERRHHTHDGLAEQEKQTSENPIVREVGENRGS